MHHPHRAADRYESACPGAAAAAGLGLAHRARSGDARERVAAGCDEPAGDRRLTPEVGPPTSGERLTPSAAVCTNALIAGSELAWVAALVATVSFVPAEVAVAAPVASIARASSRPGTVEIDSGPAPEAALAA